MTCLALVLALAAAQPAQPADGAEGFVRSLRQATARNDRAAVSRLLAYPLEVSAGGLQIPVADAATLVRLYDSIFTAELKAVIARARVPAPGQVLPAVATRPGGGLTFEGAVTVAPVSGTYKVTRLTVPLAPAAGTPGAAVARHLTFRVGSPTVINGAIDPGGLDRYEFNAVRGAFIEARLTGVPGRSVLMRLVDASTGKPVDARADRGTRVWTGRVGSASTYRIDVVRQADSGTGTLLYTLSVALK